MKDGAFNYVISLRFPQHPGGPVVDFPYCTHFIQFMLGICITNCLTVLCTLCGIFCYSMLLVKPLFSLYLADINMNVYITFSISSIQACKSIPKSMNSHTIPKRNSCDYYCVECFNATYYTKYITNYKH